MNQSADGAAVVSVPGYLDRGFSAIVGLCYFSNCSEKLALKSRAVGYASADQDLSRVENIGEVDEAGREITVESLNDHNRFFLFPVVTGKNIFAVRYPRVVFPCFIDKAFCRGDFFPFG